MKPHFAAIQPPPPRLAPAVLQADPVHAPQIVTTTAAPGPFRRPRQSRVPRISGIGAGLLPPLAKAKSRPPFSATIEEQPETTVQLTDKDIDERVCFLFVSCAV